jgi:hypothetical protein
VRRIIIWDAGEALDLVKRALRGGGPEAAASLEDRVDADVDKAKQTLDSDEPGREVLPPPAAKLPGRKLPQVLLVGPHPQMFHSLAEAVQVAIPGDIIEIRTDGPLLEEGAELRVKHKVKGAALVIRAGRGFQPVVRAGLTLGNADLKVVGIHFAPVAVSVEDGNVLLERCTMTKGSLNFQNAQPKGQPLEVVVDHCFLRNDFCIHCSGSGITLTIRDSGLCHSNSGGGHIIFDSAEDNALFVHQSTLVHVYFLSVQMGNELPRNGFRFRMARSVFGVIWAAPSFVIVRLPDAYIQRGQPACRETLQRVFGEFTAADNLCHYYFPGALQVWSTTSGGASYEMDWDVFPSWAPDDATLKYGKRIEEARFLVFDKGNLAEADRTLSSVLPEDLVVQTSGPLASQIGAGVRYGCDVTQLPVPPPLTLQAASR